LVREKVRIFALARELDMESKDLLNVCRQAGIDVKNQLSTLDPDQRDLVELMVRKSQNAPAPQSPTASPPLQAPSKKVPILDKRAPVIPARPGPRETESIPKTDQHPPAPAPTVVPPPEKPTIPAITAPPPMARPTEAPTLPTRAVDHPPAHRVPETPAAKTPEAPPRAPEPPAVTPSEPAPPAQPQPGDMRPAAAATQQPRHGGGQPMRNLDSQQPRGPGGAGEARKSRDRIPPKPSTIRVAPPPQLKSKPPEQKQPPAPTGPRKISEIPKDLQSKDGPITIEQIIAEKNKQPGKGHVSPVAPILDDDLADDDEKGKGKGGVKRPGAIVGREDRHKLRNERQAKRKQAVGDVPEVKGKSAAVILLENDEGPRFRHKIHKKKVKEGPKPRKGKVPITLPITVRSLSEAMGMRVGELLTKFIGAVPAKNINSTLDPDEAETIALEHGVELEIKRQVDVESELLNRFKEPDNPEDLVPRAPVVTIMGHVDHGKTSLLDKIRKSNVVATEAGGITQVIRAWRVEHGGRPITFLDTPGHEAFTMMRARGANVTDIAVIVVAADDGVMPQTEEAIAHAKAAGVSIVVAINKVDLPSANVRKTEQQLYGLDVLPDNMGGEAPFVHTSAATGKGIDELLDTLSLVAELKELKANPNRPASGTCLEAHKSEGEGVFATILVQNGTLRRGDVVLCGATYGRVRAMYDDLGRPIQEAGPTVPVRITGLDDVPNADDPFLVVEDLTVAREIAEKRQLKQIEAAMIQRAPLTLESLSENKVTELKVILKAEARGSIEAIRKELDKLTHEEVRVRILHAAIGGITESDVQLALTSPADTIIVGFNAVPDDRAQTLAEERGLKIQQYNIIYNLTDDIRSALEGKLKPREEVIHLGRALVRETFKISRVGTIAGCVVTKGTIERSAKVRVIRNGVVVYPPPDRTASLESLKRFKEDVREVREGFECGLRVAGYDDIKVDDVIEAYRIEQVQRTLS
jgi:translation initiation factor IF-2